MWECDKTFKWLLHLIVGKIIYIGEKSYKCEECGKLLTNAHTLLHRKALILEKNYINVEKPFISAHILFSIIREFILNKM